MLYKLKPIQWDKTDIGWSCRSPTHSYNIFYDYFEKAIAVRWLNLHTRSTDIKFFDNEDEAKEWVETVHIPSKLKRLFDEIKEEDITKQIIQGLYQNPLKN